MPMRVCLFCGYEIEQSPCDQCGTSYVDDVTRGSQNWLEHSLAEEKKAQAFMGGPSALEVAISEIVSRTSEEDDEDLDT